MEYFLTRENVHALGASPPTMRISLIEPEAMDFPAASLLCHGVKKIPHKFAPSTNPLSHNVEREN